MKTTQNHEGRLYPIIKVAADLIRRNPALLNDENLLRVTLYHNVQELHDKSRCANCDASMKEYVYTFSYHHAILLKLMGDEVVKGIREGKSFTDANSIPVSRKDWAYVIQCKTSQARFLGLVAKAGNAHWAITRRGFAALRGERVPARVTIWRNKIEQHHNETTTLYSALNSHRLKVEATEAKGKEPKSDYRKYFEDYNMQDWVEFGGIHSGKMI